MKKSIFSAGEYHVDYSTVVVNGRKEELISPRGVIKLACYNLRDNPKARIAVKNYCEFLVERGYPGCADKLYRTLFKAPKSGINDWINRTYAEYVLDGDDQIKLFRRLLDFGGVK